MCARHLSNLRSKSEREKHWLIIYSLSPLFVFDTFFLWSFRASVCVLINDAVAIATFIWHGSWNWMLKQMKQLRSPLQLMLCIFFLYYIKFYWNKLLRMLYFNESTRVHSAKDCIFPFRKLEVSRDLKWGLFPRVTILYIYVVVANSVRGALFIWQGLYIILICVWYKKY